MSEIVTNVSGTSIIFLMHPRGAMIFNGLYIEGENLHIVELMGYLELNYLVERAKVLITYNGGITEEMTMMGVLCITLHDNTGHPEKCAIGTNELIGTNFENIKARWISFLLADGRMAVFHRYGMDMLQKNCGYSDRVIKEWTLRLKNIPNFY